jgi:hypothetical protein
LPERVCDLRVPAGLCGFQVGEANARLIAAAPDLLAACERLSFAALRRESTMGDPCNLIAAIEELREASKQARDAITKATCDQ